MTDSKDYPLGFPKICPVCNSKLGKSINNNLSRRYCGKTDPNGTSHYVNTFHFPWRGFHETQMVVARINEIEVRQIHVTTPHDETCTNFYDIKDGVGNNFICKIMTFVPINKSINMDFIQNLRILE